MARMTTNRSIGTIRGKDKVNGLRKPKKIGNKSNEPTWQK